MKYVYLDNETQDKKKKRQQALVCSSGEWENLVATVEWKERAEKDQKARQEAWAARRQESEDMVALWDNTYVNMRKTRYEELMKKRAVAEALQERQYWEMRREEEAIKAAVRRRAVTRLRLQADCARSATRALTLAETMRVRKLQEELAKKIEADEIELDKAATLAAEGVFIKPSPAPGRERAGVRDSARIAQQKLQQFQDEKVKKNLEEKEKEKLMLKNIADEIKQIEENEWAEKKRQQAIVIANTEETRRMKEEQLKILQEEDAEEKAAIAIVADFKKTIGMMRKQREIEARQNHEALQAKVFSLVKKMDDDSVAQAEARIDKDVAARKHLMEERNKKDADHALWLKKQAQEVQDNWEKEEAARAAHDNELFCWAALQRRAAEEANKSFDTNRLKTIRQQKLNNREAWLKQMEEIKMKLEEEKAEDLAAFERSLDIYRHEDESCLKYAESLLEESKKVGRPIYPLEAVIVKLKKQAGLVARKPQSPIWKSNVPINNPAVEEEDRRRKGLVQMPDLCVITRSCPCVPTNGLNRSEMIKVHD